MHSRKKYLDAIQLPDRELSLLTTNNILKIGLKETAWEYSITFEERAQ